MLLKILTSLALATLAVLPAAAAEIHGPARVVDGNTIEIGGGAVRLFGIAAPEDTQICTRGGQPWRCGQEAGWALAARIERHWVTCDELTRDEKGLPEAICFIGGRNGINLNRWMIASGWAVVDRATSTEHTDEEDGARRNRLGVWSAESEW
jgi:endonuclease YncB( thermonuclease family)